MQYGQDWKWSHYQVQNRNWCQCDMETVMISWLVFINNIQSENVKSPGQKSLEMKWINFTEILDIFHCANRIVIVLHYDFLWGNVVKKSWNWFHKFLFFGLFFNIFWSAVIHVNDLMFHDLFSSLQPKVREMCDVCYTSLFNAHFTCTDCGIIVCIGKKLIYYFF